MAEVNSLLIKQCLLKTIKCYWSLTLQGSFKQKSVTENWGPPRILQGVGGGSKLFLPFYHTIFCSNFWEFEKKKRKLEQPNNQ